MASSSSLHLLLLPLIFSFLSLAATFRAQTIISVSKDPSSLQYLSQIHLTDALLPSNLVVDLSGRLLWLSRVSPTAKPVPRRSIRCLLASSPDGAGAGAGDSSCVVLTLNGVTGMAASGRLEEDTVAVDSSAVFPISAFQRFLFSFSPDSLLSGLASGADGMMGLGRSRIALPEQVAAAAGAERRFFLCLSASDGVIVVGGENLPTVSPLWAAVSRSLTYTPLLAGDSNGYLVDLKSVKVNGERVDLTSPSMQLRLSTVVPYTTMESSIYRSFVEAYAREAAASNLTRAAPVAPFDLCFSSDGVETTATGPAVPAIDLVLQSEMVKWRIHGRNSMVRVSERVMCLGFLDGGESTAEQKEAAAVVVVVGGYQLEDVLLGFDLGASMVGFSSLLTNQRSCSDFSSLQRNDIIQSF